MIFLTNYFRMFRKKRRHLELVESQTNASVWTPTKGKMQRRYYFKTKMSSIRGESDENRFGFSRFELVSEMFQNAASSYSRTIAVNHVSLVPPIVVPWGTLNS